MLPSSYDVISGSIHVMVQKMNRVEMNDTSSLAWIAAPNVNNDCAMSTMESRPARDKTGPCY